MFRRFRATIGDGGIAFCAQIVTALVMFAFGLYSRNPFRGDIDNWGLFEIAGASAATFVLVARSMYYSRKEVYVLCIALPFVIATYINHQKNALPPVYGLRSLGSAKAISAIPIAFDAAVGRNKTKWFIPSGEQFCIIDVIHIDQNNKNNVSLQIDVADNFLLGILGSMDRYDTVGMVKAITTNKRIFIPGDLSKSRDDPNGSGCNPT